MKKFLVFSVSILLSTLLFAENTSQKEIEEPEPTRLESYTKLQKVIAAVELLYVDDVKLDKIVDKAINGLLHELDAHSSMLNKESYKEMQVETKGEFGGLGIVIGQRDGALTIISPIDDTPAYKAGVKSGDIIIKIDDASSINMSLSDAIDIMRGKPGTLITITVVRKGVQEPIEINIVRDIIKIQSVYAKTINDDILYLRISSFMDMKVASELKKYIKQYEKTTKGIVLDLRNNPGGQLGQAIDTTNIFVDKGIIVSQKGKDDNENEEFEATSSTTLTDVPMVVLVNGGSASASEIVSGALQDLKRAVIIGETTFGKGSVQRIIPINDDGSEAIKLTIAKYYLPSGRTIQAKGIVPDITVFPGKVLTQEKSSFKLKESNMRKHLEGELEKVTDDSKKEDKEETKNEEDKTIITKEMIMEDNQLKAGIDILKSLTIIQN
ncbi:S41 family peptidase [Arcobacter sp. 15-2]|uniref:S41 family peptidase n=1 Tax=Arcobacter sp. 15-2 TaxID=3374109 RepID=UPI00399D46BF